jgi:hypothetical protein
MAKSRKAHRHEEDEDTEADAPRFPSPISITSQVLAVMASAPKFAIDLWSDELRAISLAAAAAGDFKSAIDGYRDLGKSAGLLTEKPQQHLHLYNAQDPALVREAPTESLEQRLAQLRKAAEVPALTAEEAAIADLCA